MRSIGYGAKRAGVGWRRRPTPHPDRLSLRFRRSTLPLQGRVKLASAAHQRAVAVLERTERFIRRNGRAQVIEVARILRLGWLLHLEQIGRVDLAAVGADGALAEQRSAVR